jgi:two-component system, cell cycle sensor histidine kinase and response regulator CckA
MKNQTNLSRIGHWLFAKGRGAFTIQGGDISSLRLILFAVLVLLLAEIGMLKILPNAITSNDLAFDGIYISLVLLPVLYFGVHKPLLAQKLRQKQRGDFQLLTSRSLRIFNSARDERVLLSVVLPRVRQKLNVGVAGVFKVGSHHIVWADPLPSAHAFLNKGEADQATPRRSACGKGDCRPMCNLAQFLVSGDGLDTPAHTTSRGSVWWRNNRDLRTSISYVHGVAPKFAGDHKCGMQSLAFIPIYGDDGIVEILVFGDQKPNAFDRETIHMLEWIANALEMATSRWESESKLTDLVESLKTAQALGRLGSFDLPEDGQSGRFSEELLRILGRVKGGPKPTLEILLASIHSEDRERIEQVFESACRELGKYAEEFRIVRPGGEERNIYGVGRFTIQKGLGTVVHHGAFQDITQRLRDAGERSELESRVSHKHSLEIIGKLAGGVAHDFNNILTSVLCNAEILIDCFDDGIPSKHVANGHLKAIQKSALRASRLTRQLLMFGRKPVASCQEIGLPEMIADMVRMFQRLLPEDIQVSTAATEGIHMVEGDAGAIEQMLLNLVLNARDSMPEGGRLMIDLSNVELSGDAEEGTGPGKAGKFVQLSVSDTGFGMDEKILSRAFEPFFTTKKPGKGTGLGLAMVKETVAKMKGFIRAKSHPGLGSIFQIYLPASTVVKAKARPRPILAPVQSEGQGILVCEDDRSILELTVAMLENAGYQVFAANGGHQALELARLHEQEISLLITDVIMPDMSGKEVAELLHKQIPLIRTLFISGYTDDVLLTHGIESSTAGFLGKPFTGQDLLQNVQKVLKRA